MRSTIMIFGAVLAAVLVVPIAGAQPRGFFMPAPGAGSGPGGEGDATMMFPMLLRRLGLTPDQSRQVRDIMEKHRPKFQALFTEVRAANEAMASRLFSPGTVTAAELDPSIRQVASLREQLVREGANVALEIRTVLTPEQLAKAADIRQKLEALHTQMKQLLGDPMAEPLPPPAP